MIKNSRVYVVQDQKMISPNGVLVNKFDLRPAEPFGELITLLPPTAGAFDVEGVMADLWNGLRDYRDGDHLLLVGNPCLIGWAVAIAAKINDGRISVLQWQARERRYFSVSCRI